MKLIILRLNTTSKPSPMSEGVAEIQIYSRLCKGINLTTRHTCPGAPQPATIHDVINKLGQVLPHPSAIFHEYASASTPWVPRTLPHCTPVKRGKVSSNLSTHDATQFGDSICPICISTFKCLFNRAQPTQALIDTGGGYHLGAPNLRSGPHSTFPSSILYFPLIAPPSLQLCQPFDHLAKPHWSSIDREGPITSGFQPLVFYDSLHN
jgi:hypothetical protein